MCVILGYQNWALLAYPRHNKDTKLGPTSNLANLQNFNLTSMGDFGFKCINIEHFFIICFYIA